MIDGIEATLEPNRTVVRNGKFESLSIRQNQTTKIESNQDRKFDDDNE